MYVFIATKYFLSSLLGTLLEGSCLDIAEADTRNCLKRWIHKEYGEEELFQSACSMTASIEQAEPAVPCLSSKQIDLVCIQIGNTVDNLVSELSSRFLRVL